LKNFAVIGDPVEHSLSPILHNWVFEELGIRANYSKKLITESALPSIIENLRTSKIDGLNVTIPHKVSIMSYLDDISPHASEIGSVNCIMKSGNKIIGNNTDWYGFAKALDKNMININDKEVIILGAGGVAKGVIFALKKSGVKEIKLFNRTIEKAQKLASEIVKPYSFDKIEESIKMDSIIINCTSVGMKNNNSPVNVNFLSSLQIIIDTIYTPLQTTLLINAKNAGAQTMNGLDMFIHQGLASLDIWFGEPISDRVNFTDIKNNLEKILC